MAQISDRTRIGELTLPYRFRSQTQEGDAEVVVDNKPKDPYFKKCKPFMYTVALLNLWGDREDDCTLGEIRQEILHHAPKNFGKGSPQDYL